MTEQRSQIKVVIGLSFSSADRSGGFHCDLSTDGRAMPLEGSSPDTTAHRVALRALTAALLSIKTPGHIHVVTSSEYLARGLTEWIGQFRLATHANGDLWSRLIDAAHTHLLSVDLRAPGDPELLSATHSAEQNRAGQHDCEIDTDRTGDVLPLLGNTVYAVTYGQPFTQPTLITGSAEHDPSVPAALPVIPEPAGAEGSRAEVSSHEPPAAPVPAAPVTGAPAEPAVESERERLDRHFDEGRAQVRQALKKNPYLVGHTLLLMDADAEHGREDDSLIRVESMIMTALAMNQVTLTPPLSAQYAELVTLMHGYLTNIPREAHTAARVTTTFSDAGNWTAHAQVSGQPLRLILLKEERTRAGRILTGLTTPQARLVTLTLP